MNYVFNAIDGWEMDIEILEQFQTLYNMDKNFIERIQEATEDTSKGRFSNLEEAVSVISMLYTRYLETQHDLNEEQAKNDRLEARRDELIDQLYTARKESGVI